MKHSHEFRDPIHTFISVRTDERKVIDSRPFQRLRHIHQLALTYLVYPGATHKRFEHSIGVMELASRVFDVVTDERNIRHDSVREIIPDQEEKTYWKSVLRMAALCHDLGHLPFSHAAEHDLLPTGYDHERLTVDILIGSEMAEIWDRMRPKLCPEDIAKIAVGAKKYKKKPLSLWEAILSEIVIGDAFGVDRMDYLLRDAYHAGVQYGMFDHHRLISSLRILPQQDKGSEEPALGLDGGGLESSEGLMLARHFMYKQVYLHNIRRIYDIHLKDFLADFLPGGHFSTDIEAHLSIADPEVIAGIRAASRRTESAGHRHALRIESRDHFPVMYSLSPLDRKGGKLSPGKIIADAAAQKFGSDLIRHDQIPAKASAPDFPVRRYDGKIESSLQRSQILARMPEIEVDNVYCDRSVLADAVSWKDQNLNQLLELA